MTEKSTKASGKDVVAADLTSDKEVTTWIDKFIERMTSLVTSQDKLVQQLIAFEEAIRLLEFASRVIFAP